MLGSPIRIPSEPLIPNVISYLSRNPRDLGDILYHRRLSLIQRQHPPSRHVMAGHRTCIVHLKANFPKDPREGGGGRGRGQLVMHRPKDPEK